MFQTSGSWVTPIVGLCGELDISKLQLNHSEVNYISSYDHMTDSFEAYVLMMVV